MAVKSNGEGTDGENGKNGVEGPRGERITTNGMKKRKRKQKQTASHFFHIYTHGRSNRSSMHDVFV